MLYFLIVVEGPHDAALLGVLLRERGFGRTQYRSEVDSFWAQLIPTQFPANPQGRLDHVVQFPDLYTRGGVLAQSVAVVAASGYDKLIVELQASLDILGSSRLSGIAVIADADDVAPAERFTDLRAKLHEMNRQSTANGIDGFPLGCPPPWGLRMGQISASACTFSPITSIRVRWKRYCWSVRPQATLRTISRRSISSRQSTHLYPQTRRTSVR